MKLVKSPNTYILTFTIAIVVTLITLTYVYYKISSPQTFYSSSENIRTYTYNFNMYVQDGDNFPFGTSQYDKMLKERFGIEFVYDRIPRSIWKEKTQLLFASNQAPDITIGGKEPEYKQWAQEGYLQEIDLNLLPSYKALWQPQEWEFLMLSATSPNGKLYYLPSVRVEKVQLAWLYRKDIFDEHGLTFPTTMEELYETLKALRKHYPDKILLSSQLGAGIGDSGLSSLTGLMQAFWLPELSLTEPSFIDPKTNEWVGYGFSTQRARHFLISTHNLYKENLIDPDILSQSHYKFQNKLQNGEVFMSYDYAHNVVLFNKHSKENDPNANWEWSPSMITAYPEKGTIYKRDPYYSNWGPAFSKNIITEPGKFEAILRYYDWCSTEEGLLYSSFGIENESYFMNSGIPTLYPSIVELSEKYGIPSTFPKVHDALFQQTKGKFTVPLEESFTNARNYYYFEQIPFQPTNDDEVVINSLSEKLKQISVEYIAKFCLNALDPSDDDYWNEFITDLKKAGLNEYENIRKKTIKSERKIIHD